MRRKVANCENRGHSSFLLCLLHTLLDTNSHLRAVINRFMAMTRIPAYLQRLLLTSRRGSSNRLHSLGRGKYSLRLLTRQNVVSTRRPT
jgi:hypothetical protein